MSLVLGEKVCLFIFIVISCWVCCLWNVCVVVVVVFLIENFEVEFVFDDIIDDCNFFILKLIKFNIVVLKFINFDFDGGWKYSWYIVLI